MPHTVEETKAGATHDEVMEFVQRHNFLVKTEDLPTEEEVRHAARAVLVGSSFKDPGPDWTQLEVYNQHGLMLWHHRMLGY